MDWIKIDTKGGRRVWYIDLAELPPWKAEEFIERMRKAFKKQRQRKPKFEVDFID